MATERRVSVLESSNYDARTAWRIAVHSCQRWNCRPDERYTEKLKILNQLLKPAAWGMRVATSLTLFYVLYHFVSLQGMFEVAFQIHPLWLVQATAILVIRILTCPLRLVRFEC